MEIVEIVKGDVAVLGVTSIPKETPLGCMECAVPWIEVHGRTFHLLLDDEIPRSIPGLPVRHSAMDCKTGDIVMLTWDVDVWCCK